MCVNLSLNDIYWDPPPLCTVLTSLRISETSKPLNKKEDTLVIIAKIYVMKSNFLYNK